MTKLEILKRARNRVAKGFCQGAVALNENGARAIPDDPAAVRWCLYGSIENEEACAAVEDVLVSRGYVTSGEHIRLCVDFSETSGRTQQEVLEVLDLVIERESR